MKHLFILIVFFLGSMALQAQAAAQPAVLTAEFIFERCLSVGGSSRRRNVQLEV